MTRRAMHMLAPALPGDGRESAKRTACGQRDLGDVGLARYETTPNAGDVTCRACRHALRRVRAAEAIVAAIVAPATHANGQRPASRADLATLWRSIRGEPEDPGPRWRSVRGALEHEARVVLDGAPVRSSSDPDRYGVLPQRSVGEVPVPQAIAGREDVIAVRQSIDTAGAACADACALGLIPTGVALTALDFVLVLRWTHQGEPVRQRIVENRKGEIMRLVPRTLAHIAAELSRRHDGAEVTETQARIAAGAVTGAFADALRRRGELARARVRDTGESRRKTAMAAPEGWDLDGWKEISSIVGRSDDVCQRLAARAEDPLPIDRYLGRPIAKRADVLAWVRREVERARAA